MPNGLAQQKLLWAVHNAAGVDPSDTPVVEVCSLNEGNKGFCTSRHLLISHFHHFRVTAQERQSAIQSKLERSLLC